MATLQIYKASAGSGKTFTLAVEYIRHLVVSPTAYRNILAVTFTNKATGEMKQRILSQLWGISVGDPDSRAYLDKVCEATGFSADEVVKRAGEAMSRIIHDYSRFQVTTIDAFFQTVMRNLARELGLGASINLDLDTVSVLDKAVDKMVERLNHQSLLFNQLIDYIKELIGEDRSWKVLPEIKSFGRHIFNESFMEHRKELHEKLETPRFIAGYKGRLKKILDEAPKPFIQMHDEFFRLLADNGLDYTDLKGGKTIGGYFVKLKNGDFDDDKLCGKTIEACLTDASAWRKKKYPPALTDALVDELQGLLRQAEIVRANIRHTVHSAKLSLQHINKVALLAAIDKEVQELCRMHNRFLLANTNILLADLIQEGDSSFVFEKIGANIRHVMIDEFQDTSRLQWRNFRLLLLEGLSQGADSLIVGDVKQAIYRWRSGDWSILAGLQGKFDGKYPIACIGRQPTVNRRSEERIILFNNHFFTAACQVLNRRYRDTQHEDCVRLQSAYSDVEQAFPEGKGGGKGYVKIAFPHDTEEHFKGEVIIQALASEVVRLIGEGVRPGDIAILVRTNKYIPQIVNVLKSVLPDDVPVVSNEAYRLDASQAVLTLIETLRCMAHPDDTIARMRLEHLLANASGICWEEVSQVFMPQDLPLYELLERLVSAYQLDSRSGEEAYLMAFFDAVMEYIGGNSSDLDEFLAYWDERLRSKTIPAGSLDGVQIFTIHKSKGLEFHTVLVPFATWAMESDRNEHLVWCSPSEMPYAELPLLPINYGKNGKLMDTSIYHTDFLNEQLELWVDNLNVLYVAFTRATANLIVFCNTDTKNYNISSLIRDTLALTGEEDYEEGELCASPVKNRSHTSTNILLQRPESRTVSFVSHHRPLEFRQSNASSLFIAEETEEADRNHYISQGSLLHRLFSEIRTADDVEQVLQEMETDGLFSTRLTAADIRRIVHRALANRQASEWFASGWILFNECSIVSRDKQTGITLVHRPDRVMMTPDRSRVIVVDFKFGKPASGYAEQVRTYMALLRHMGFPTVEGYLWYVYAGRIEEVVE